MTRYQVRTINCNGTEPTFNYDDAEAAVRHYVADIEDAVTKRDASADQTGVHVVEARLIDIHDDLALVVTTGVLACSHAA